MNKDQESRLRQLHTPTKIRVHSVWETVCKTCDPLTNNWPCETWLILNETDTIH